MSKKYVSKSRKKIFGSLATNAVIIGILMYEYMIKGDPILVLWVCLFAVFLFSITFHQMWQYIEIVDDYVIIVNGIWRKRIEIGDFQYLYMGYNSSSNKIPSIVVCCESRKKSFPIYFRNYDKDELTELLEYIRKRNLQVEYCDSLNKMIAGVESEMEIQYRKDSKQLGKLLIVSIIIAIIKVVLEY